MEDKSLLLDDYVLYAEDDLDDQELFVESLEIFDPNKKAVCVNNGVELLEFLDALKPGDPFPSLIILDLNMPQLNGEDTLTKVKENRKYVKIPVVFFSTSYNSLNFDLLNAHNTGFEVKPRSLREWQSIAAVLLKHSKSKYHR